MLSIAPAVVHAMKSISALTTHSCPTCGLVAHPRFSPSLFLELTSSVNLGELSTGCFKMQLNGHHCCCVQRLCSLRRFWAYLCMSGATYTCSMNHTFWFLRCFNSGADGSAAAAWTAWWCWLLFLRRPCCRLLLHHTTTSNTEQTQY